jgi:hypothetical protein
MDVGMILSSSLIKVTGTGVLNMKILLDSLNAIGVSQLMML